MKAFIFSFITALILVAVVYYTSMRPVSYAFALVKEGQAVEAVYATAVVEPVNWAALAPVKTGRIVEINVHEDDKITKGQVLARLDDADLRAQLAELEALSDYYAVELRRAEDLIKKGHISQERYDTAVTNLTQTEARISMVNEQIRQLAMTAPIDGTVLWRDVELGEVKPGGEPLFWVGQPKPLHLVAEIDEEDIPHIRPEQNVLITADAFPGEVLNGKIKRISPKGDPVSKSYRVYATLPDNTPLMIGMTVETNTIIRQKENTLLVPAEALTDGPALWLAIDKNSKTIAKKSDVQAGIRGEEKIEILSGIKAGDRVLLPPFDELKDGDVLKLRN